MIEALRAKLSRWRETRKKRGREKLEKTAAEHEYDRRHESSPYYDIRGGGGGPN